MKNTILKEGEKSASESADYFISFFKRNEENALYSKTTHQERAEIFHENSAVKELFFVESGMLKLTVGNRDGEEAIIGLRRKQWLLGVNAAFLGEPHLYTATTITPCVLRKMTAKRFFQLIKNDAAFSYNVHVIQAQQISDFTQHLTDFMLLTAEQRVEQFLCSVIRSNWGQLPDNEISMKLNIYQHELSRIIGVSQEHLCRIIKTIEKKGSITFKNSALVIHNPSRFLKGLHSSSRCCLPY